MELRHYCVLALAFLVFLGPHTASACECYSIPLEEEVDGAAAVFQGLVVGMRLLEIPIEAPDLPPGTSTLRVEVEFRAPRAWKGVRSETIKVETGIGGGDCGYSFRIGESYLVFANGEEGLRETGICSSTKLLRDSGEVIESLGSPEVDFTPNRP